MDNKWIISEAERVYSQVIKHRRFLHENAEIGFEIGKTYNYVFDVLLKIGCKPKSCGKSGIIVVIEGEKDINSFKSTNLNTSIDENKSVFEEPNECVYNSKRCILLRADMDALPMQEETDLLYKSKSGCMHSCGHDMHTAMLLGCAEILWKNRDKLSRTVKLMFQPAEETLEGAYDMMANGVLTNPRVDFGAMIHVITGTNLDTGTAIIANQGFCAPSADFFKIDVKGRGAHGAMPDKSVDSILIGAHIIIALEELVTRESIGTKGTAITIGKISSGRVANVIPEELTILGSLRTYSEDMRSRLKKRLVELVDLQAKSFRGSAHVEFTSGTPAMRNDGFLSKSAYTCLKSTWNTLKLEVERDSHADVLINDNQGTTMPMASEDFSYVSEKIPTVMIGLCAGKSDDGYSYPLHHPKATFDEKALLFGTIAYTELGINLRLK